MLRAATVLTWLLLSGCAYHKIASQPGRASDLALTAQDEPCVMLAADGAYGSRVYAGSGRAVATRVSTAVRTMWPEAPLMDTTDEPTASVRCASLGSNFLVEPIILHWEDRATNWSGIRDKIQIEVRLLRIKPRAVVRSTTFEARNNWFVFTDEAPSELMDRSFDLAVTKMLSAPRRP